MKKLFIILVSSCAICLQTQAQQAKALAYIEKYKDAAIAEMQRSGVPAAITLAQGMLESAYGESDLCKQSNNHFGIKCKAEWTGDKVYHNDDTKNECFRAYPDAAASYKDHSDFLKSRDWYAPLFKLSPTDVDGWAYGLKKAGYATEKDYPQRLLKLINDYNLNQYTLAAMQPADNIANTVAAKSSSVNTGTPVVAPRPTADMAHVLKDTATAEQEAETVILSKPAAVDKENRATIARHEANYPNGIFSINHTKVMYVHAGTSLILLATEHHIDLAKLVEFNELQETDLLQKDGLIFLERKQKKGEKDFHIVTVNETLHDICQKEGVRMDYVLVYNNLNKNAQPAIGEKVYLKAQAPVSPKTAVASINNATVKNSL
jgi:Muramidase (flagellum-specific)